MFFCQKAHSIATFYPQVFHKSFHRGWIWVSFRFALLKRRNLI